MATVFTILVFPNEIAVVTFEVYRVLQNGGVDVSKRSSRTVVLNSLQMIRMGYSVCNPFIYGNLHVEFKRTVNEMLHRREKMKRRERRLSTLLNTTNVVGIETGEDGRKPNVMTTFMLTRYKCDLGQRV